MSKWRKVEGMGRNQLIQELVVLREVCDLNVTAEGIQDLKRSLGVCCCECDCTKTAQSCQGRCLDCEESCE